MQTSFPFNAVITSEGYDRVYTAEDYASERAAYISDGTLNRASLKVTPVSGRTVSISAGMACIRGRTYWNSEPINMTLSLSDAVYTRIDRIVLRLDYTERNILLQLKQGTPSSNPTAPNIIDNEQMCEIPIAKITVAANASVISESAVTDERILASFPLDYDEIVAEYTKELRDELGVNDLRELKEMAQCVTIDGAGNTALFNDGKYRSAAVLTETARYTSNGTFSTYQHPSKDNLYHIVLVGGGGGGSARYSNAFSNLVTGGGSGAMFNIGPIYIPNGSYSVIVGAGGAGKGNYHGMEGSNGGSTSILNYAAGGGLLGSYGSFSGSSSDSYDVAGKGYACYPGENGVRKEDGGKGGSTLYGTGGAGYTSNGATGGNATGYGAGGGCGGDSGIGGNGSGGLAIIYAYR